MKPAAPRRLDGAFTLIEVLVIVVIVVVIWNVFLLRVNKRDRSASTPTCLNHLKQIGLDQLMWSQDHDGKFPWEVSLTNGGTVDLVETAEVAPHFQVISNHVNSDASIFICPTDEARNQADSMAMLSDSNISYFINLDAVANSAASILAGDRHLQVNGWPVPSGLKVITTNSPVGWTRELHPKLKAPPGGSLVFVDGHAEFVRDGLNERVARQGRAESRFVIP